MPAPVPRPGTLTVPSAEAPHTTSIRIPADDVDGPGCGWAFTGMTSPAFDADVARATEKNAVETTKTTLTAGVKTWSTDVLTYWAAYEENAGKVAAYNTYAQQVTAANTAWEAIGRQWTTYRANYATWQKQVDARAKFLTEQEAAGQAFDEAIEACEAVDGTGSDPAPTAPPLPSATGTATPQPTTPPKGKPLSESDRKRAVADCIVSVERPDIIVQTPPTVGAEPVSRRTRGRRTLEGDSCRLCNTCVTGM